MSSPLKLKNTSNSYLRTEVEEEGFWVEEAIVGQFLDESLERVEKELVQNSLRYEAKFTSI